MTALHVVVQRPTLTQGHTDHRALGALRGLADCLGNFPCLALAEADAALLVPYNDESCKAETLTTLHRLGNPIDRNEAIGEFRVLVAIATAPAIVFTCHYRLLRTSGRPRGQHPRVP